MTHISKIYVRNVRKFEHGHHKNNLNTFLITFMEANAVRKPSQAENNFRTTLDMEIFGCVCSSFPLFYAKTCRIPGAPKPSPKSCDKGK